MSYAELAYPLLAGGFVLALTTLFFASVFLGFVDFMRRLIG
jgi:hypothetical protein